MGRLVEEKLDAISGKSINGERKTVVSSEKGTLIDFENNDDPFAKYFKQSTINLLKDGAFASRIPV
ncbi:MAG: hypothetical protein LKF75_04815 [Bacilli bacterium]|jgi:hypothetical protein|nr:hypothetical protein [Bacilli bacterium]MCH4228995.1 hypothetical protein [Bacilli bacterium]